ncbi:MAG: polymerase sigma-70 factor, subfamily [Frankiaceae bacterium]|jgi:RNA polymerase sigma-70 factor (ECF subfamily)|nr:polymerase sigma-70 factor, subfamily [Frankiaceae bacterium]
MTHALFGLESDNCPQCGIAHADSVARSKQEFDDFYARFQPRLLRYARRAWGARDAEEITQETLVRAYESIDLGRDDRSLWGWLVVVGRNVAADIARARRLCDVGGELSPHEATADPRCVEQTVLDSECLSTLGMALSALPPSQSRAWWLSVAEGMTPTGIAESLACSPEAVRQALFKSRKRLAAAMADFCERTAAIAAPVLFLMRRGSHRVGRGVAPAAANGLLSAAVISTSALTATVFTGGTSTMAPAVTAHAVSVTRAVPVSDALRMARPNVPATRVVRTTRSAQTHQPSAHVTPPVVAYAHVARNPLAPGEQAHERIVIDTPLGSPIVVDEGQRHNGSSVICGRLDQVHCD